MNAHWLLAMGSSGGGGASSGGGGGFGLLFLFGGLFLIWWFLFLRPQFKRQKDRQKMLDALKKGDRVVTRGGLLGTIVGIKEKVVVVRIAENVKVEVLRSSLEGIAGEGASPQPEQKE
ncbi:MAG: preprotein translocase subunit YajC [Candidatus Eisenbacteria bacterium]|nr:preprotein translocase subunit YajC [Candidatus Eisenbacteria bacterium]